MGKNISNMENKMMKRGVDSIDSLASESSRDIRKEQLILLIK